MTQLWRKIIKVTWLEWRVALTALLFVALALAMMPVQTEATLNCSIATTCTAPNLTWLRMESSTNSHVAIGTSTDYGNLVCCDYVSTMTTNCSGSGLINNIINLSSTTNAHVESSSLANYSVPACLRVATGGYVSSTVQMTDCSGYEETIASMPSTTNAHMGGPADYVYKICASAGAPPQSLTFNIYWNNSLSFGTLSPTKTRYIDSDGNGTDTNTSGNSLAVSTNATYGYTISVKGATLTSGANTIAAIGASPAALAIGTNQFGIAVDDEGRGAALAPYILASGYGYAADATTTSNIASSGAGSGHNYGVYYIANIAPSTPPGNYSTVLTYVVTANY